MALEDYNKVLSEWNFQQFAAEMREKLNKYLSGRVDIDQNSQEFVEVRVMFQDLLKKAKAYYGMVFNLYTNIDFWNNSKNFYQVTEIDDLLMQVINDFANILKDKTDIDVLYNNNLRTMTIALVLRQQLPGLWLVKAPHGGDFVVFETDENDNILDINHKIIRPDDIIAALDNYALPPEKRDPKMQIPKFRCKNMEAKIRTVNKLGKINTATLGFAFSKYQTKDDNQMTQENQSVYDGFIFAVTDRKLENMVIIAITDKRLKDNSKRLFELYHELYNPLNDVEAVSYTAFKFRPITLNKDLNWDYVQKRNDVTIFDKGTVEQIALRPAEGITRAKWEKQLFDYVKSALAKFKAISGDIISDIMDETNFLDLQKSRDAVLVKLGVFLSGERLSEAQVNLMLEEIKTKRKTQVKVDNQQKKKTRKGVKMKI